MFFLPWRKVRQKRNFDEGLLTPRSDKARGGSNRSRRSSLNRSDEVARDHLERERARAAKAGAQQEERL